MDTSTALRTAIELLTQVADRACANGAIAALPPDFDDRYDELTDALSGIAGQPRAACSQPPAATKSTAALMTAREVMADTAMSRSTLYRLIREGRFPAPAKVGTMSRWHATAVADWKARLFA
ncbi:helix-turn-helix transcriptional regulator [Dokdonella fugitiva]|uniref:AlpA family transcriptional regulator n=1 Tax=Dokdonella fugitiva TaxID=328517 RepID=A0A4R2IAK5_9GAMM|nr:AlpA family phage regulatory protein [Dokdonella fugitiva]TCO40428.1 AlpA family transcriptional regulator [Dokdonella fugitiva]